MAIYFVTQSGAGAQNGTSLSNAWAVSGFNASANWSSPSVVAGKISPGDVALLNGIITGQLNVQLGGVSGAPITVLFNTGTKMSAPYWTTAGAINIFLVDYITIDGGTGGLIESTANGTNLPNKLDSKGIRAINANNLTVRNLSVTGLYVRVSGGDTNGYGYGISNTCSNQETIRNFAVSGCILSNAYIGVECDYGSGCSSYEIANNVATNCNWGVGIGDRHPSSSITGISIHNNVFSGWQNWNGTGVDIGLHHNGTFLFSDKGGSMMTGVNIYNNSFGPGFGGADQTSAIYINGGLSDILINNNFFLCNSGEYASNGMIVCGNDVYGTVSLMNNTLIGGAAGITIKVRGATTGGAQNINIENNVALGNGAGTFIDFSYYSGVNAVINNNFGYRFNSLLNYSYSTNSSSNYRTFAQWQGLGFDTNGATGNPNLSSNYYLSSTSPYIGSGVNLTSYFTTDANGNTRPASGPWDIGAYLYAISQLVRMGRRPKFGVYHLTN